MKKRKSKTEYLSYIEETPKHSPIIGKAASTATNNARRRALNNGLYVTYLDGNKIVREYPDGRKETMKTIQEQSITMSKNGKLQIPER